MSRYFILFALLAGAFACAEAGGGSGDLAEGGMGGSGISQGPITAFGSIFVNDIKWELDNADFEVDGELLGRLSDTEVRDHLNVGMVVRVRGNAGTRKADHVFFDDEIEGPVSVIDEEPGLGEPGQFRELTVLGQRILIEAGVTRFFDDKDPVGSQPDFGFDTIAPGDVVEISGLLDGLVEQDAVLRATSVERQEGSPGPIEVELKGIVSCIEDCASSFMLGSVIVAFDVETDFSDLPGGADDLDDGTYVEVEGTLVEPDRIMATEIELEDDFDDDDVNVDEFSTTGFVNGFTTIEEPFFVGNQKVDASGEIEFEHGNASMLENGRRIEVEGELIDGFLIADEIEFEDQEVRVHAAIESEEDLDGLQEPEQEDPSFIPSFKLLGIEIRVLPSTRIDGDLDTLGVNDFLEVRGIVNTQGVITASRVVTRDNPDRDIRLDGPVELIDETTGEFTILGVTVLTTALSPPTEFFFDTPGALPEPTERLCFFENLNEGDFVEVKGINGNDGSNIEILEAGDVELKKEEIPLCS